MVRKLLANLLGFGWPFPCLTYGRGRPNLATKWSLCGDWKETSMRDDDIVKAAEDDDLKLAD
jgi:hypothetical protein